MPSSELSQIVRELNRVFERLSPEDVKRAARCILSHERVFVGGAGRTGLMLKAFAMRLMQMGRTVYAAGESVTPAVRRGDLVFLASASGSTYTALHYARAATEAGADLFVVTAAPDSPLAAFHPADILLPCGGRDRQEEGSEQVMGSLFEQALLLYCDAVVMALDPDPDVMRSRHANLE